MNEQKVMRPRRRRGVFGPLLLIAVGVIFLLSNIGVLQGDAWGLILQLWPVILIVIGLDNIWQREGIVGATLLIGAGAVFLLGNLGMLSVNPWQVMLRLWPVLLIAIGFDVVIGRRNWVASLLGSLVILAILAGALWMFGVRATRGEVFVTEQVSQTLEDVRAARVRVEPGAGLIHISALTDSDALLQGNIAQGAGRRTLQDYERQGDVAVYTLRESGTPVNVGRTDLSAYTWDIAITDKVPVELTAGLGAGEMRLDLTGLTLDELTVNTGVGSTKITLPETGGYSGDINAGIGELVITVPDGLGIHIDIDSALTSVDLPSGHEGREVYQSSAYASAVEKVELHIKLAIGSIRIVQQ